jgi:prolyl-tRNA synthetase
MRPRSGLLRAKEFVMKDMYSFHTTENDALKYYEIVSKAYHNILKRIEIPFAVVSVVYVG